jgi:hypothetical protein
VENTITVSVPFLGITLDVNDLTLLAAITFLLLLSLLLFNMRREEENLSMLFDSLTDELLPSIYRVLSMTQVFTIPPALNGKRRKLSRLSEGIRRWLARLLFLTPLIVECFVLWDNYKTLPTGQAVSQKLANLEFGLGILCFATMFVLTAFCLRNSIAVSRLWTEAYDRIQAPRDVSG